MNDVTFFSRSPTWVRSAGWTNDKENEVRLPVLVAKIGLALKIETKDDCQLVHKLLAVMTPPPPYILITLLIL